jgi:hypothetical protein
MIQPTDQTEKLVPPSAALQIPMTAINRMNRGCASYRLGSLSVRSLSLISSRKESKQTSAGECWVIRSLVRWHPCNVLTFQEQMRSAGSPQWRPANAGADGGVREIARWPDFRRWPEIQPLRYRRRNCAWLPFAAISEFDRRIQTWPPSAHGWPFRRALLTSSFKNLASSSNLIANPDAKAPVTGWCCRASCRSQAIRRSGRPGFGPRQVVDHPVHTQ